MSVLGWILLGLVGGAVLVYFWNKIREWLTTTVLDWIEREFGYKTRQKAYKAIVKVDKVGVKIRRTATVIIKSKPYSKTIDYVDYESIFNVDKEVIENIKKNGSIENVFVLNY